jgi:hypothetical protein
MAKHRHMRIDIRKIDSICDVQVEGRVEQVVLIWANTKGRKVVEDLWPDVEWDADEKNHPNRGDWLFAHIRVTRLPPFLGATPEFSNPDALGFAVACAIQRRIEPRRVVLYTGYGPDMEVCLFEGRAFSATRPGEDVALYADYVPLGTPFGGRASVPS